MKWIRSCTVLLAVSSLVKLSVAEDYMVCEAGACVSTPLAMECTVFTDTYVDENGRVIEITLCTDGPMQSGPH